MTRIGEFQNRVAICFDRLKRKASAQPLVSFPFFDEAGNLQGFLEPITQDYRLTRPELPELLSQWRAENPSLSPSRFPISVERTAKWLDNQIIGRTDRLLFLVVTLDRKLVGHLGYSNFDFAEETAEIDSVLRGIKEGYPGIMNFAMKTLLDWGINELGLQQVKLSVVLDNVPAIRFYERLGFVRTHTRPLRQVVPGNDEQLEVAPEGYDGPVANHYLYMSLGSPEYEAYQKGKSI